MTAPVPAPTVDDAVRSHISWMTAVAGLPGGMTIDDGSWRWSYDAPNGTLHALFPQTMDVDAACRALDRARELDAAHVAVWSATDVERPELVDIGFEVGWSPCWMGRSTAGVDEAPLRLGRRTMVSVRARPRERDRQPLLERPDTFRIEARAGGAYAGRAWGHVHGGAAGLYDMVVRVPFRRQGLGAEVVLTAMAEAARRGADRMTLNATPEGELLYRSCGFVRLGTGRTWWWHRVGAGAQPRS